MTQKQDKIIGYALVIFIVSLFAYFFYINAKRSDWVAKNCIPDFKTQTCTFNTEYPN